MVRMMNIMDHLWTWRPSYLVELAVDVVSSGVHGAHRVANTSS